MKEMVIVTLTSYGERLSNLPVVLDTIISQTVGPNLIVLNLAYEEDVPIPIWDYLTKHNVKINRVPDTKVYKKLIPTLKRYPNDIVISIDDDWLYPKGMIADFLDIHTRYPNNPISGNKLVYSEMICHCGCASLTKAEYFGPYLNDIEDVIQECPCDDITYTYFANKAGHPYVVTNEEYFTNMTPYNEGEGYSGRIEADALEKSHKYLLNKYGDIPHFTSAYLEDKYTAEIIYHIHSCSNAETERETMRRMRTTRAFRLGKLFLRPFALLKE